MIRRIFTPLIVMSAILQVAVANEQDERPPTAGQFAIQIASERPEAFVSACVAKFPVMKNDLDQAIAGYRAIVEKIGKQLLASDDFASLNQETASRFLLDWYRKEKEIQNEKYKDVSSESDCNAVLRNLRTIDEKVFEAQLTKTLTGTKAMMMKQKAGGEQ